MKEGDVVLVKDSSVVRNVWPFGIVEKVFPCDDGNVRKANVRVRREGKSSILARPITELVLLVNAV